MVGPRGLEVGIPPRDVLADKADGSACLVALGIESQPAQELEDVERVGVVARPRPAAPLAVGAWSASSRAPQPSVATRARSAAMTSAGSSVRSRITCQRIEGSASSSQSMTTMR